MTALAIVTAMTGTFYLYSAFVLGWRGLRPSGPNRGWGAPIRRRFVDDPRARSLVRRSVVLGVLAGVLVLVVFGAVIPAFVVGGWASTLPTTSDRHRRADRRRSAADAWPRLLEGVRSRVSGTGSSLPAALFEAATGAPPEMQEGFAAGRREWHRSTDFDRACAAMRREFRCGVADIVLETLAVAHEVGGREVDRRLRALIDDRVRDLDARHDADARRAGARFGRRFVLVVPVGMALAGIAIGDGRAAFGTASGQFLSSAGIALVAACWWWAGLLLRPPAGDRRFA